MLVSLILASVFEPARSEARTPLNEFPAHAQPVPRRSGSLVPERALLKERRSQAARIVVHGDKPTVMVSRRLYGIFFEEINCAGDGGLYAEMVRNRSFQDSTGPDHWNAIGGARLHVGASQVGARPYLEIDGPKSSGAANGGYFGMAVRQGERYLLNLRAELGVAGGADLLVGLQDAQGNWLSKKVVVTLDSASATVTELTPSASLPDARLAIVKLCEAPVFIDRVSLTPARVWKGRPNGLRTDLAKKLADLRPAFVRFPGGCWVEGDTMATAMRWKETIGDVWSRRTLPNLWGYQSTNGLGYHEYLQMCEDLGAEPMFVINCGMSHKENVPLEKMGEFVQDALDAIEYANGPTSSVWGAKRAAAGHPKPFNLRLMEIGNENGGRAYEERYPLFVKAIKAKHPEVTLIANVWGGTPKSAPVEVVDEHYYSDPRFFFDNADKYDGYDRKGPKVYVGEYAVTQGCGQGNLIASVAEAAFMTGMERNSDHVVMASYAPLFANVNAKAWNPDLINFDSARSYGTPSYYVQKLFSANRPDRVLTTEVPDVLSEKQPFPAGGIGVGTWGTQAEFKDLRVVQNGHEVFASADGTGLVRESGSWTTVDGAVRQTSGADGTRQWAGGADWRSYTLTLKARKLGGAEGFLVTVGRRSEKDYLWWNVGGWGNSRHAVEHSVGGGKSLVGKSVQGSVETGRWYDLKVEYSSERIRCWLDGKLVHDETAPQTKSLFVTAGLVSKDGTVIIKAVNGGAVPIDAEIVLEGKARPTRVSGQVLTSASPLDENSLKEPTKVSPKPLRATVQGRTVRCRLPACSVTVVRCRVST